MKLAIVRWATQVAPSFLLSALVCVPALAQAPPKADALVLNSTPRANYGAWPLLAVQNGANSYIQFDLSALPQDATVTKATLRLYVDAVATPGSFDVFQGNSAWQENTLNFSDAPLPGASATNGAPVAVTASIVNQFLLIDVTSLVEQWVSGALPNNGLVLELTTPNGSFSFDSKESTLTSHEPELEMTLEGTAGPQGPQGVQGVAGPQGTPGPAGPQGSQGIPGPIGPQGATGDAGSGFRFRNVFDPNQSYAVNDVATYNGSAYIAIVASAGPNNVTPDLNSTDWSLMAQAGAPGATGAAGPQGLPGEAGATGATGPAGAQGSQGLPGPQGAMGLPGPTGPQGQAGPQGPAGTAGTTFTSLGAWNNTATYMPGNFVTFNGSSYLAVVSNSNAEPDTSSDWVGANISLNALGKTQPTVTVSPTTPGTCYLGELRLFPYQIDGGGWLAANGQLLPLIQWQALFSLLGTQFGGNGVNNFALPDYRSVAPNGSAYYLCANGIYP